jgi:hypothetical protein
VERNATPAGSHQEGTTTVNEYTLDRSKYEAEPFYGIAVRLEPYLDDPNLNGDGLASSAYFNAELMAISVETMNRFNAGQDIAADVARLDGLTNDQRVEPWLEQSKYAQMVEALKVRLRSLLHHQHVGISEYNERGMLQQIDSSITKAKENIQEARALADSKGEDTWVRTHNQLVGKYNALMTAHKSSKISASKADLAFNKCLDPAVLMSKYQQVDLTSHEASVNALPDN